MQRKQKKLEILENIKVENYAAEGKCIARVDGVVVFIEGITAPGDVIDIQILKSKNNYKEGKVIKVHTMSADRVEPFCSHFGLCGGCKWQHLPYDIQLSLKQQQVIDQFNHLAKLKIDTMEPILGSEKSQYYRNKLEFTFSNYKWLTEAQIATEEVHSRDALGFHIPKRFDKILDIDHCYLQPSPSNEIRLAVKEWSIAQGYDFFDARKMKGFLRNLIIRNSNMNHLMVVVQFADPAMEEIEKTMAHIAEKFPQITSLNYVINQKGNDTFLDLEVVCYKGLPYMEEKMNDVIYRISPKSFFQTNSQQALNLYQIAVDYADLAGDELVYDLYTGTGTIANFVASKAKKVIGLEYVPEAIEDAKLNSSLNSINNTDFYAGDMRKLLTNSFTDIHGKPDVVITDPPRAGMDVDVVNVLLECAPKKIVYISCNPATQARDVALLSEKYEVIRMRAVDMFPHTHHIENVALLHLKA
jgi:23S rRNA (uracil1939-C5)-methyltransferase